MSDHQYKSIRRSSTQPKIKSRGFFHLLSLNASLVLQYLGILLYRIRYGLVIGFCIYIQIFGIDWSKISLSNSFHGIYQNSIVDTINSGFWYSLGAVLQWIGFYIGWAHTLSPNLFPLIGFICILVIELQIIRAWSSFLSMVFQSITGSGYSFFAWAPVVWGLAVAAGLYRPVTKFINEQLHFLGYSPYLVAFTALALFKALEIVVHTISYNFFTQLAPPPLHPTVTPADVTVIVCTAGAIDAEFAHCLKSILANHPAKIIVSISTTRSSQHNAAARICASLDRRISVLASTNPNLREQFIHAATSNTAQTSITAYVADAHVFWPRTFLRSALAPFQDPSIGLVRLATRVLRDRRGGYLASFLNYLACVHVERQNFECTARYNIDGGVPVGFGRTALVRTDFVRSLSLEDGRGVLGETWAWGFVSVRPIGVDGDDFMARCVHEQGYRTVFHNDPRHALVSTTIDTTGGIPAFREKVLGWARATWRGNTALLFADGVSWEVHPWSTYTILVSSLFDFALIYDPLLAYTLYKATGTQYFSLFFTLLFTSKLIEPFPHLRRNPWDVGYFFGGVLFGYAYSLVKIWALITS
ncbi:hypothetical protein LARI1_G009366 [Lachnellula arida]|uniref:Glycosyltransferase family 2 protein n=1 Tax=Lachnellula arida TaxID=1316785 RepID=A0A8T9AZR8_9HELO|nr:hypothetical protein LARI1_G009366 [Lachnellula arida]